MKTKLLFVLCLFSGLFSQAQVPEKLADLKAGDWFVLECSRFLPVKDGIPALRNADVVECQVSILEKGKDNLRISLRPVRFYRSTIGETGFINYFDSDYASDFNSKGDCYFGQGDSVIFKLNLKDTSLSDTVYYLKQENLFFPLDMVFQGVKKSAAGLSGKTVPILQSKMFFETIVRNCFAKQDSYLLFQEKEGQLKNDNSTFHIKLIEASFPLLPNVKLSYFSSRKLTENQLNFEAEGKQYKLKQNSDGFVNFELFLSSPAVCKMVDRDLLLTQGDSLSVFDDGNGNLTFSGKGSVNNKYYFEFSKNRDLFKYKYFQTVEENVNYLQEVQRIYQSLWDKYASGMSPYWLCSSQLSFKYWYINQYFYFQAKGFSIPWKDSIFTSVVPLIDYKYQPLFYDVFLDLYSKNKIFQLTQEDVLMGGNSLQADPTGEYYFYKNFFLGYSKDYQLSECLKKLMKNNSSSYFQREYDDFLSVCKNTVLSRKIKNEYEDVLKSEPGKNIKDLSLNFLGEIPLKNKADGYILIVIGSMSHIINSEEYTLKIIEDSISVFYGKIQLVKPLYKEDYRFSKDSCAVYYGNASFKDCLALKSLSGDLLLIRNDGTIVAKNIRDYWNNSFDNGDANWHFKTELIRKPLLEDLEKMEKSRFDASFWGIIIGSIVAFLLVVFLVYKIRIRSVKKKEESKRLISELELKAIRSQMNPHFIFNALSSIQHLINKGDNANANRYLLNFSKLLRMVLTSSEKKLIPLSEEIEQIDLYLKLEQLRVPFEYKIYVDESVSPEEESIPGMLIQPIVENAVIHGIVPNQGGRIQICFNREDKVLLVDVSDDGPGFALSHHESGCFGLKATEERLRLVNDELKTDIGINIERNEPSGTRVIISVPI